MGKGDIMQQYTNHYPADDFYLLVDYSPRDTQQPPVVSASLCPTTVERLS